MWSFEHTETTRATPVRLWARYAGPTTWPQWDAELAAVTVDGPMATGTRGVLKPVKGPAAGFTFTEVSPGGASLTSAGCRWPASPSPTASRTPGRAAASPTGSR